LKERLPAKRPHPLDTPVSDADRLNDERNYMIGILTLLAAFGLLDNPTVQTDDAIDARFARRVRETNVEITLERPNEATFKGLTLSGIAVQLVRTDNPLQLVNPFAPPEYGAAEANVSWSPITGKAHGLKVFALTF
jgi:hypothetical protein